MKKQLIHLGFLAVLTMSLIAIIPREAEAFQGTRYNPCVCYTYFSDGHIEVGESCEHPTANGACAKSKPCLPQNEEDRIQ